MFDIDRKETITISKFEYYYLIEQAEYLQLVIRLDRLEDYIKSIGGKGLDANKKAGTFAPAFSFCNKMIVYSTTSFSDLIPFSVSNITV